MPVFPVWVVSCAQSAGSRRRGSVKADCQDAVDVDLCRMAKEELEAADMDVYGHFAWPERDEIYQHIFGLMLMTTSSCAIDLLQRTPQIRAVANFFGGDWSNMTACTVLSAVRLHRPLPLVHEGHGLEPPKHIFFDMTVECFQRAAEAAICTNSSQTNMLEVLEEWAIQGILPQGVSENNLRTCVQLPFPISCLVAGQAWTELAFDRRLRVGHDSVVRDWWKSLRKHASFSESGGNQGGAVDVAMQGEPPPAGGAAASSPAHLQRSLFDIKVFEKLGQTLREWAPVIEQNMRLEPAATRSLLEVFIKWADDCVKAMLPETFAAWTWQGNKRRGGALQPVLQQRGGYNAEFLCQTLMFTFMVRGTGSSKPVSNPYGLVVHRVLQTMPPHVRQMAEDMIAGSTWPSPMVIVRGRLYLDVAYMLSWQARHAKLHENEEEDSALFSMVDSSPQGGRDWLMHAETNIPSSKLPEALMLAESLSDLVTKCVEEEDALPELAAAQESLADVLSQHLLPPAALGSRHSSADHKFHAFVHGVRLENADWMLTSKHLGSIFAMTTDMGAERQLVGKEVSVQQFFEYWNPHDRLAGNVIRAQEDLLLEVDPSPVPLSTKQCLHIPGTFHLLENIQKRILGTMQTWDEVRPLMESMCHCFHYNHVRERFISGCLTGHRQAWRDLFTSGPPLFEGGRVWGVTVEITEWLLVRKDAIIDSWQEDRVQFRQNAAAAAQDQAQAQPVQGGRDGADNDKHVRKATEAIGKPLFWATMELVSILSEVIGHLESWTQGCSCHDSRHCQTPGLRKLKQQCPMRGRRCPELAVGEVGRFVRRILAVGAAKLTRHVGVLTQQQRQRMLQDFDAGKALLLAEWELRASCFLELPLKLLCVGHPSLRVARTHMAICLAKYDALAHRANTNQHPLAVKWLDSNSPLRQLVLQFVHGAAPETLGAACSLSCQGSACQQFGSGN